MRRLVMLTCLFTFFVAAAAQAAPATKRLPADWAKANKVGLKQGARDSDRDGLTNWGEYRAQTNPRRRDSDRDGVPDALEDRDRDKLTNADELLAGTDPRSRDSDGDKTPDGREDRDRDGLANAHERVTGHDLRKRDTDGDGVLDGHDNAGWVTAVTANSVTIRLATGGNLTAYLNGDSWVECSTETPAPTSSTGAGTSSTPTSTPTESPGDPEAPDAVDEEPAGTEPDPDVPAVEDDPAMLPVSYRQDDEPDADVDTPDLGACGSALRVGAIVHRAAVEAGVLTDLELMRG